MRYLLCLLLTLVFVPLLAQEPGQPVRLELPFSPEETSVELIPLPDSSLLEFHKTSNVWGTKASFYFAKYDYRLEEVWSGTADLDAEWDFIRSYTESPYTYLVFRGNDSHRFAIVRVNNQTGRTSSRVHELEMLDTIYEFNVLHGRYFIIGQNGNNSNPLLLYINPDRDEVKPLPAVYGRESTFSDMLADPAHGRLDVVVTESNGRISRLQLKSFDPEGNLINNNFVLPQADKSLLNAEATPGDSAAKLLLGTFGTRDLRYAQGFFTIPAIGSEEGATFYNVLQLKNFLKYMKPRREERVRRREEARQQLGKDPGYRYRLLLHDLISTPTGYILAAEAYYPQFHDNATNVINRTLSFNRGPERYRRTHVVALGFDKQGTLLWDNSFVLYDVATPTITHAVEVGYSGDSRVIVAYPEDEKIIYHVMQDDKFTDEETSLELLTYDKKDKVIDSEQQGITHWYGNNFAAFGFQRINKGRDIKTVFYINKISF